MTSNELDLIKFLIKNKREEILQSQRLRTQLIGVKITFIGTAVGLIVANELDERILVVVASAAVFFDLLINGQGFSIKRLGLYCRRELEPNLRKLVNLPDLAFWEEFLEKFNNSKSKSSKFHRQYLNSSGNFLLTILLILVSMFTILQKQVPDFYIYFILLFVFLFIDFYSYISARNVSMDDD